MTGRSRRARPLRGAVVVVLAATACLALPALAGTRAPSKASVPKRRVLLLPGHDFRVDPAALFVEGDPPPTVDEGGILTSSVEALLRAEPEVSTLGSAELQAIVEGGDRSDRGASPVLVVRGLLHLGQERYRDIRIPEAVAVLEQGIAAARKTWLDVVAPDVLSDLHLYQGLCYLELGQAPLAHVAFKNLLMVTPLRRFRKGWFPPATEAALKAAAEDLIRTMPGEMVLGGVERLESLMRFTRATALVVAYLDGSPGEPGTVHVRVAETARQPGSHILSAARVDAPWTGREAAAETASRSVTAWLSCTALPSREAVERPRARFYLDTTSAYSVFLKVPTRRIFQNAGFGLGLAWQVMDGLDVFGRVNLLNAFEDPYGDLVKQFWTVRALAGVGYSLRGNWGRVFVHTGIAFDYLSGFESTTDPNCKFWPDDPQRCPASNVRRPNYLFGAAFALGVDVTLFGPIYLVFQAGVAAYFVSNESDMPVNFPISLELGLGYAFF